jgi:aminoglycoside 6'-N-acetyltransferase I
MLAFHRFTAADLESAAKVYVSCFNVPLWNDDWSLKAATKRLETLLRFPGAIGFVATGSEKIVGLAIGHSEPWADGRHFYLNELCIEPERQRQGVGETLLGEVPGELRSQGISSVYLLTETSTAAESFFRKHGFEIDSSAVKLWREI